MRCFIAIAAASLGLFVWGAYELAKLIDELDAISWDD